MIFRQLFDHESSTYTYLIASRKGGEALIIDPVLGRVDHYISLLLELELRLVKAIDTHVHADHVTALGALRDETRCITVMGEQSKADVVSMRVREGDRIGIEGVLLDVLYTPGHTDDSYSFLMGDRVFTGDTLLIRGTGRTDFQNGSASAQYDSIFGKLLKLPDDTLVYPAHDYKGDTVSSIAEERASNPRLQISSKDEYMELMNGLNLAHPKMMDVAVPANLSIGLRPDVLRQEGFVLNVDELSTLLGKGGVRLVDVREAYERRRNGVIPGSVHLPYAAIAESMKHDGILASLLRETNRSTVFYCSFGELGAMSVEIARQNDFADVRFLEGGMQAWLATGGAVKPDCT